MMDDKILLNYLDKAAQKALKEVHESDHISEKNAMTLLLKAQFNHIAHLDQEMVRKDEFNGLKSEFKDLKENIKLFRDEFEQLRELMLTKMATKDELNFHFSMISAQMNRTITIWGLLIAILALLLRFN